jgi:hypothetical protein
VNDPLQDVVNALRETTSGEESGAARYTRSRVLAAVRLQKRQRVFKVTFGLPLAAILVGSGAWAASGQSLPVFVERVSVVLGLREAPSSLTPAKSATKTHRQTLPPAASSEPSALAESAVSAPDAVEQELARTDWAPEPARAVSSEPPASTQPIARAKSQPVPPQDSRVTEQELSLYETAHRAHFVDKDSSLALNAWNEYLRQVPHGRFAVEATYNRALCLLRLGRTHDARLALTPFAKGVYGSYRKTEATALLEQLERDDR